MGLRHLWIGLCSLVLAPTAVLQASPITYSVQVDTSSLSGTAGSLEFQFNPGDFTSQPATMTITGFTGGTLGATSPAITGDVSGALPGTVTFDNGTGFNDMLQDFTYGSSFRFTVTFSGPALDMTDPNAAQSTFSLTVWDSLSDNVMMGFGIQQFVADPNSGATLLIDIPPGGGNNIIAAPQVTVATPEPASVAVLGVALFGLMAARGQLRKRAA